VFDPLGIDNAIVYVHVNKVAVVREPTDCKCDHDHDEHSHYLENTRQRYI